MNSEGLTAIQSALKALVVRVKTEKEEWDEQLRNDRAAAEAQRNEDLQEERRKQKQRQSVLKKRKQEAFEQQAGALAEKQAAAKQRGRGKKGVKAREAEAATLINSRVRGFLARSPNGTVHQKRIELAATKLQRTWRGYQARKQISQKHPDFYERLRLVQVLRNRSVKRDFGESVTDIIRCLLKYKVNLKVEDSDWNTLLHLAAETGDAYGPTLIGLLKRHGAPNHRKNKHGQSPFDLAISRDHAACALALRDKPPPRHGKYEDAPTEYHVVAMSPFMKTLGDLLYCRPWPEAYREMLQEEQPQRADDVLPSDPPVEFLDDPIAKESRRFEPPFEITNRRALGELTTLASPRIRKRPKSEDGVYTVGMHDPGIDKWLSDMLALLMENKEVELLGNGNGQVEVYGFGVVKTLNVDPTEIWVYRFRNQHGLPPPGIEEAEPDDTMEEILVPDDKQADAAADSPVDGEAADKSAAEKTSGPISVAVEEPDEEESDEEEDEIVEIDILSSDRVTGMFALKKADGSGVTCVMSVGDAGLVTGHRNGDVRLWIKGSDSPQESGIKLGTHDGEVTCLLVVGQHAFTGSKDGSVRHWNTVTQRCEGVLPGHVGGVVCMCVADDKCRSPSPSILFVAAGDGGLRVWVVDREDYACLCILQCPDANTIITCMCIDPNFPCLYAAGNITKQDKHKHTIMESIVVCFSLVNYLKLYILRPEPPNRPALRRMPPPPPEPDVDEGELLAAQEDIENEVDLDAEAKKAKKKLERQEAEDKAKDRKLSKNIFVAEGAFKNGDGNHEADNKGEQMTEAVVPKEERVLEAILNQAIQIGLMTEDSAETLMTQTEDGQEDVLALTDSWTENVKLEFEKQGMEWIAPVVPEFDATSDPDMDTVDNQTDQTDANMTLESDKKSCSCCRRNASKSTRYMLSEPATDFGSVDKFSAEKAAQLTLKANPSRRVKPKKKREMTIARSHIFPHKGERLPMIAKDYRLLIPGCLYYYELEVKNNSPNFAWLSVEDPQEPFTEFVMCQPSSANVRLAERLKPDGRASYTIVWKVGVAASDSAKLIVILRAKVAPIQAKPDTPSFRMLFRGVQQITEMLFLQHVGPAVGFNNGTIIAFGAFVPPRGKHNLENLPWEKVVPRVVHVSKRLAAAPVGKTLAMRCWRLQKNIAASIKGAVAMLNPANWPCCKKQRGTQHNQVVPLTKFHMDQATEKLRKRDDGMGAFKNEHRRLLLGFKRSMRLRDGDAEATRRGGQPITCMWYDVQNQELFFAVDNLIGSIDISARISPWNSPSQVLPAMDYIVDLAKVSAPIAGILPVSSNVLVTAADGSVNRVQMVPRDASELRKAWNKHVMAKLVRTQIWCDRNLGKLYHLFHRPEVDLSLELQAIGDRLYSVRKDGEVSLWSPDVQRQAWGQHTDKRLPAGVRTEIKNVTVGTVNVVEDAATGEAEKRLEIQLGAKATRVIGQVQVFVVICKSPPKTVAEAEAEREAAEEYEYIYSDEDEEETDADVETKDENKFPLDDEDVEDKVEGEESQDAKKGKDGFDELEIAPDSIFVWQAGTGQPIEITMATPLPLGEITCATVGAGFVVVGRDCGSLDAYHIRMTQISASCSRRKMVPELEAAQHYVGHKKKIDGITTVGQLAKGGQDMFNSNVLLYSYNRSRVLVHEIKSGKLVFSFETRPGLEKGRISHLDCFRVFQTTHKGSTDLKDHVVVSIGTDVEIWSCEGNVKSIASYSQDQTVAAATAAAKESTESEEDDDMLVFEIGQGAAKEVAVEMGTDGPRGVVLQRHAYTRQHTAPVTSMVVQQRYAFTGCAHGTVRVWRCTEPWQCLLTLTTTEGPVSHMLVPDLNTVWVAYGSGFVRSWDLRAVHADMQQEEQAFAVQNAAGSTSDTTAASAVHSAGDTATFSSGTGMSTVIFPLGYAGLPPVRSLCATSMLGTKKNPVTGERRLVKNSRLFASCVDGTIYQLYPAVKEPVYSAQDRVAAERRHYGVVGVIVGVTDYLHYVGLAFTVNNSNWPPNVDSWRSLFNQLYLYSNTVTGESWSGNWWLAHFSVIGFLGAFVSVTLTDYLSRERFNWKFGTGSAGLKVGLKLWALTLRVYFFTMGIPLFVTVVRPYITAFNCSAVQTETICWGFAHIQSAAISAGALMLYLPLSWRVQRAYGDATLFSSRAIGDIIRADRDRVHHTITHNKFNYPRWVDCCLIIKFIAVVCVVFLEDGGLAIACLGVACVLQIGVLLIVPPFGQPGLQAINWFLLGSLLAALLSLSSIWWAAWHGKDSDSYSCREPTADEADGYMFELTAGFHWLLAAAATFVLPALLRSIALSLWYIYSRSIGRRLFEWWNGRQVAKARKQAERRLLRASNRRR
eukprot:SAG31_NODE_196_length_20699_cov_103.813835_8_plen_2355_part_00